MCAPPRLRGLMPRFTPFFAATLLLACGSRQPLPAQAPTLAAAPGSNVASVPTRVSAPADLVGVLRIKNPAELADTLSDWAHLPIDWKTLLASQVPGLTEVAALDSSLDAVALLAPANGKTFDEPFVALSLGLKSLQRAVAFAREQGQEPEKVEPDLYQLGGIFGNPCAMGPALGRSPARLVCAQSEQALRSLMPYATRGLPLETLSTTDVHLELRAEPLRQRYGSQLERLSGLAPLALSQLGQDHPLFDRALSDAVHGLIGETLAVVQDLDKLSFDINAGSQTPNLELKFALDFRTKTSWSAQVAEDAARSTSTAPELFWRLPKDATLASFRQKGSVRGLDPIKNTVAALVEGYADHQGLPEGLRKDLAALIQRAFAFNPPALVGASGELSSNITAELGDGPLDSVLRGQMKWGVTGFQGSASEAKEFLGLVARLVNHAALKPLAKKSGLDSKALPRAKLRPAPQLAAGAELLELRFPAALLNKADDKLNHKDFNFYVAVIPEGEIVWIVTAPSEAVVRERAQLLLKGGPTLAQRSDLAPLKTEKAFSGGFLQVQAILAALPPELGKKASTVLSASKHHGESPAFFWSGFTLAGNGVKLHSSLVIPRDLVADVAAAAAAMSF